MSLAYKRAADNVATGLRRSLPCRRFHCAELRIYILPRLFLRARLSPRPSSASLCMGAPCHAAQMKAWALSGWAHSSSAARPGAPTPAFPSLPFFLFREVRGTLTLSAAAGTFENNCLYDCYFFLPLWGGVAFVLESMAAQYRTGERQFPFMSQWKGCIFSAVRFSCVGVCVCHAVLIYWSSFAVWRMEEIQRFFRGVPRRLERKEALTCRPITISSLSVYYLLVSPAWFYEVKKYSVLLFSGRGDSWGPRKEVCSFALVHLLMHHDSCTPQICIFKESRGEGGEKYHLLCVFSPLHALTHLTQQQMAVCHQSVDSSLIFPPKDSQRKETRVQMAVHSATSHPLGVMKEGLSRHRTPSQCLQERQCPEPPL